MHAQAVFRFAPSPTGYLHLGHALSAIVNYKLAQRFSGRFLVRIEDIDSGRIRESFVSAILEDLAWLGLDWEEPVWRQSQRFATYNDYCERLSAMGVLYPCFATRTQIVEAARRASSPLDPDGAPVYPGLCRGLSKADIDKRRKASIPYALRLDMAKALLIAKKKQASTDITITHFSANGAQTKTKSDPARWGDIVIARKDNGTSYHLASVIDDAAQEVTHVCRGKDLEASTDIHRLLQILLDLPPPFYHHHELLCDNNGRKLSKSAHDTALHELRKDGWTPNRIHRYLKNFLRIYDI